MYCRKNLGFNVIGTRRFLYSVSDHLIKIKYRHTVLHSAVSVWLVPVKCKPGPLTTLSRKIIWILQHTKTQPITPGADAKFRYISGLANVHQIPLNLFLADPNKTIQYWNVRLSILFKASYSRSEAHLWFSTQPRPIYSWLLRLQKKVSRSWVCYCSLPSLLGDKKHGCTHLG